MGKWGRRKDGRRLFLIDLGDHDKLRPRLAKLRQVLRGVKSLGQVVVRWARREDLTLCPSSIARYFQMRGMQVELVKTEQEVKDNVVDVPSLHQEDEITSLHQEEEITSLHQDEATVDLLDRLEQEVGAAMLGIPAQSPTTTPCLLLQRTGLFSPEILTSLTKGLARELNRTSTSFPFMFLSVLGQKGVQELVGQKKVVTTVEQLMTLLVLPSGQFILRQAKTRDWGGCKASKYEG